jgi:3-(3-hydroxy-phenyl)propionate hydroxylase
MAERYDALVVGYGPTGQVIASLLAGRGHSVCVLERRPSLYGLPRAVTIDGESARIIQASGDVEAALRESGVLHAYDLLTADGRVLHHREYLRPHPCGFPNRISMYQPHVEDALYAAALERGAAVELGWEVKEIEERADDVVVMAEDGDGNGRELVARYLIGADGARSRVREQMGVEWLDEFGFRDAWLSVDVEWHGERPEKFNVAATICDPRLPTAYIPIGSRRVRFEFLVDPDADNRALLEPDAGYRFLAESFGIGDDQAHIYRQVIFPFEARRAAPWRRGRRLLAGDAAHLMPPFLGQGARSGMRDAINLAWRLDLVLSGVLDESFLDLYEAERAPHVDRLLAGSVELGKIACERDPVKAAERDAFYLEGEGRPSPIDIPLDSGLLRRGDAPMNGEMSLQATVESGARRGRFDDIVGRGFVLAAWERDPTAGLGDPELRMLDRLGATLVRFGDDAEAVRDVDGAYEAHFREHGIESFLMRPDFYYFGGGVDEADTVAMVRDLADQLAPYQRG